METQVFTFGCGHLFANGYIVIEAASEERCREIMMENFGTKWSFQYEHDYIPELQKYGMGKVATISEGDRATRVITEENVFIS